MQQSSRRQRRGANAIEFALTLPVFLLITLGAVDFAWYAWNWTTLSSAAATACRAGSTRDIGDDRDDMADVFTFTETELDAQITRSALPCLAGECTVVIDTVGDVPDHSLRCRVNRDVEPLAGLFVGGITLQGVALTRFEYQRAAP